MNDVFDPDALAAALDASRRVRCHAAIAGALCAGADERGAAARAAATAPRIDPQLLERWARAVRIELEASDLSFRLDLPGDESPLERRVDALAAWSREFLSALGEAGERLGKLGAEAHETLRELEAIGQGAAVGEGEPEAEEAMFASLSEHVRLSALLLYRLLNPPGKGVAQ